MHQYRPVPAVTRTTRLAQSRHFLFECVDCLDAIVVQVMHRNRLKDLPRKTSLVVRKKMRLE